MNDYQRLKAALDRLQSTSVATSIRETTGRRLHRFSWVNEWRELADASGTPLGIELILPDWFYAGVLDAATVLTIDPAYFRLKVASNAGCIARCASTAGGRNTAGNSTSGICTASPAARRASRTSPTTCACWSRGSRCPATSGHRVDAGRKLELLTFRPCRSRHGDNCGKSCGRPRAIRSAGYRAIGEYAYRAIRSTKTPQNQ